MLSMNKHFFFIFALLAFGLGINRASAQEQQAYKVGLVGFYNLENLFDTINDPQKNDEAVHFHALEEEMATRSSVLAWRIPGTAGPGGLPSTGSHRVGYD